MPSLNGKKSWELSRHEINPAEYETKAVCISKPSIRATLISRIIINCIFNQDQGNGRNNVMMIKSIKVASLFLLSLLSNLIYADSESKNDLPLNCHARGYHFTDERVNLANSKETVEQQLIYLIKNTSLTKVWVNHEMEYATANAGWAIELQPGKWSALMLDKQPFELSCVELKPGAEQIIACQSVLQICQVQHVQYPNDGKGSYWAAENLAIDSLWDTLEKRGIIINIKRV